MSDGDRESADPLDSLVRAQKFRQIFEDGLSLNGLVELAEEGDGFLGTGLPNRVPCVQKEVVSSIGRGGNGWVKDGEVADAREDEVLEDRGGCG